MNYRSKGVIAKIKKSLVNYDLLIENIKSEIELREEKMDFLSCSTKKKDLKDFAVAKVEKENYEVFLSRIQRQKNSLVRRVQIVIDKYYYDNHNIFSLYYIEEKSLDEIEAITGINKKALDGLIQRIDNDIFEII